MVGRWCCVTYGAVWIKVEQGPTVLAVDAGGVCLDILFSRLSCLFSFSFSLRDGSTEIMS